MEQPWRHFTSLKLCKCSQIPHPSTRVSSTFCRWHMLRFDTSYTGGKPFLPILKLLGLTCVICCNEQLFFSGSAMFRDFLFPSALQFGIIIFHRCKQNNLSSYGNIIISFGLKLYQDNASLEYSCLQHFWHK